VSTSTVDGMPHELIESELLLRRLRCFTTCQLDNIGYETG
jgi:hypothetical protein